MDPIKASFNINLPINQPRKTSLINPYQELIIYKRQSSPPGFWAEYLIQLNPTKNSVWNVALIDDNEERLEHFDNIFYPGIKRGLIEFIETYEKRCIGLGGIDFYIKNLSFHPIDSKPAAFQYSLIDFLNRLESTKYFEKEIITTEKSSSFFETKEISVDARHNSSILKETHRQILIPRIFKESIYLKKRIEIIYTNLYNQKPTYKITLSTKPYSEQTDYAINIEYRDEFNTRHMRQFSEQIIFIHDQTEQVLEVLKTRKYNLCGLDVLVVPLYEGNIYPNTQDLIWIILNSILDNDNIEIKPEIYM